MSESARVPPAEITGAYGAELVATLPHCDELMLLGSHGLLCHEQAELEWSQSVTKVADALQGNAVTA